MKEILSIRKKVKKDTLRQDFLLCIVAVPPLVYFVIACFPFVKENAMTVIICASLSTIFSTIYGEIHKYIALKKVYEVDESSEKITDKDTLKKAKLAALKYPYILALVYSVRWVVFSQIVFYPPLLIMGIISVTDFFYMFPFTLFAAMASIPLAFILAEYSV